MLTRLKVSGFKNLGNVDISFGSFTCIAGANGVGKSNLFDAIQFLSALADLSLIEAALSVRNKSRKNSDIRSLFLHIGEKYTDKISFSAHMIIPEEGIDDLGQKAEASTTFLRYSLVLSYRNKSTISSLGQLEIIKEELIPLNPFSPDNLLNFEHKEEWKKSVIKESKKTSPFISTGENEEGNRIIKLHQENHQGNPLFRLAEKLPRTVLSVTNAAESPTASLVRKEMRNWQLLQLEPSSLRCSNEFTDPIKLGSDGSYLASTLEHLATTIHQKSDNNIYAQIAGRLSELLDEIDEVWIDKDDHRQLLTIMVKNREQTIYPAKSLSDGTLRFLALITLELDINNQGIFCLEEPENGIHPEKIPQILELLQDIATDLEEPISNDNPLRQILINTHSPAVIQQVPDDSLLVAELKENITPEGKRYKEVCFNYLAKTWRSKIKSSTSNCVSKGKLLSYVNPVINQSEEDLFRKKNRLIDRDDIQALLSD